MIYYQQFLLLSQIRLYQLMSISKIMPINIIFIKIVKSIDIIGLDNEF